MTGADFRLTKGEAAARQVSRLGRKLMEEKEDRVARTRPYRLAVAERVRRNVAHYAS